MRGLESQSLHVILRSGDPHLISCQRRLKRSDAGSGRAAPLAGELPHSIFTLRKFESKTRVWSRSRFRQQSHIVLGGKGRSMATRLKHARCGLSKHRAEIRWFKSRGPDALAGPEEQPIQARR